MSQESILNYINEKIDTLSNNIIDFNPRFLFNPQSNLESQKITFEILESNRKKCLEKNFVPLIKNKKKNFSKKKSNDSDSDSDSEDEYKKKDTSIDYIIPKDKLTQLYFSSIGILGIYILYNIMKKTKMIPV